MALLQMEETPAVQVGDTAPENVLALLYGHAMGQIDEAIEAIERDDPQRRSDAIQEAAEAITTLSQGLDFTQPGGLAGRLFALYHMLTRQLLEANRSNDASLLRSVRETLETLLDGWRANMDALARLA